MRSQGKNTCEAPEIATAIRLQVERRSGELRLFKASGKPHESNARENAQSRRVVKAIRNTALSGERPQQLTEALYIVQEVTNRANVNGLLTPSYFVMAELHRNQRPGKGKKNTGVGRSAHCQ